MTSFKRGDRVIITGGLYDNPGAVGTVVQVDEGTSLVYMDCEDQAHWYRNGSLLKVAS